MVNEYSDRVKLVGSNSNDVEYLINASLNKGKIKRLYVLPNVAVTADNTNFITLTVKKASTTLVSRATTVAGGGMVVGTLITLSITGTGADLEQDSAGVFEVAVTKSGTGPAYDFDVVCVYEGVRA